MAASNWEGRDQMILWLNKLHCDLMLELFTGSWAWAWWEGILMEDPKGREYMWLVHIVWTPCPNECLEILTCRPRLALSITPSCRASVCPSASLSLHPHVHPPTHLVLCTLSACLLPPQCMPVSGAASLHSALRESWGSIDPSATRLQRQSHWPWACSLTLGLRARFPGDQGKAF